MRAAGERVKAAIKGLLAAALLQEPRTSALLEAMAGRVAAFAQDLVDKQQWGHARVCCRFHKHLLLLVMSSCHVLMSALLPH